MHLILLSGGSGKRLWPLSNDVRSKQFLKLLKNDQDEMESMVQRVYRQLKEVGLSKSVTVVAGSSQRDQIISQLGSSVNSVIEPDRRDTFPAIALACSYLYSEMKIDREEKIAILPVDPYVHNDYFKSIFELKGILDENDSELALLGAEPTYPSSKYGYIIPHESESKVSKVDYFKEKPSEEAASELLKQGALWNCGVFGFKLGYLIELLEKSYGFNNISYQKVYDQYDKLNKISFDYEVVEKAKNINVIKYRGMWKDLGTWNTLTEEMEAEEFGNVVTDGNCTNTHVLNELNIPVVTMGIENCVVVASPDGILVAEKSETPKLKDQIKNFSGRPRYEERRWGTYMVIDHTFHKCGSESLTKKLTLNEGCNISYQYHNNRSEVWTIVSGEGTLILDDEMKNVKQGDVIHIQEGVKHGLKALTDLEFIEVQLGTPLIEEDIVRLKMEW